MSERQFDEGVASAHTLRASVSCEGIGLHSGQPVTLTMTPAPAGTGILFRRRDLLKSAGPETQASGLERITIAATPHAVTATTLGTVISNRHNVSVSTIEHVMSAFAGCGVDNVIVEINGPEVPIMDGSSEPFVAMIEKVGRRDLPAPRTALRLTKKVRIEKGDSYIEAEPLSADDDSTLIDVTVDFADPAIGRQSVLIDGKAGDYRAAIAAARTFCDLRDVEYMRSKGLALGGSLDNAIVVSEGTILNKEGLRFEGEFVRHKALDLIGDLFLLGAPLLARITAYKPGHELNTSFAKAVLDQGAVDRVPLSEESAEARRVLA